MSSDIDQATTRYHRLQDTTREIQRDLDNGLKPLVSSAVDGMNTLGRSIVDLYNVPDPSSTSATALIAKCKGQGQVVGRRFDDLHQKGQDLLRRAGNVSDNALVRLVVPNGDILTC